MPRWDESAYDRRHARLRGGGDQAGEHVLEFIGGPGESVQGLPDRQRVALQQSARLDRPAAVDADSDVADLPRDRPDATLPQHLGRLQNGELPGIARPRNPWKLTVLQPPEVLRQGRVRAIPGEVSHIG